MLIQFSREERKEGKPICPGCFNRSPVNVAVVAFPKAEAERVEVEFTPAVVAQELPLVFILSQGETGVGILCQKLSCAAPPECWEDWSWGAQQHRRKHQPTAGSTTGKASHLSSKQRFNITSSSLEPKQSQLYKHGLMIHSHHDCYCVHSWIHLFQLIQSFCTEDIIGHDDFHE